MDPNVIASGTARGRQVKILATIGPASQSPAMLKALISAGVDAIRLNMSHGTHEEHGAVIVAVRRIAQEVGRSVAIVLDLQGPKIRTGTLAGGQPVELTDGVAFTITTRQVEGDVTCVSTTYEYLAQDVHAGDTILVDDGLIELRVLATTETDASCTVIHGGLLGEHKGINLPGVAVRAPCLTSKDQIDLAFGLAQGVDYVALSFVRQAEDLADLRRRLPQRDTPIKVIAKLEKPEVFTHLDAILQIADGVMIARGDLGVELPLERVPVLQKEIIRRANRAGVLVITATQMLESMISHPRPTRAEASDVANAVYDGTDVAMLSGETAVGQFPVQVVRTMSRIITTAEASNTPVAPQIHSRSKAHALARAATELAMLASVRAVVLFTRSGLTAQLVAKERPGVPIYAFTASETVYHQLALWWGITPILGRFQPSTDAQIASLCATIVARGYAAVGDTILILGALPLTERPAPIFLPCSALKPAALKTGCEAHSGPGWSTFTFAATASSAPVRPLSSSTCSSVMISGGVNLRWSPATPSTVPVPGYRITPRLSPSSITRCAIPRSR